MKQAIIKFTETDQIQTCNGLELFGQRLRKFIQENDGMFKGLRATEIFGYFAILDTLEMENLDVTCDEDVRDAIVIQAQNTAHLTDEDVEATLLDFRRVEKIMQ